VFRDANKSLRLSISLPLEAVRHGHLIEDIPDRDEFYEVFAEFVAGLIERLGRPEVASWEQARIYEASSNRDHRERGAAWIQRRQH